MFPKHPHPHGKHAMEIYQFWEVVVVFCFILLHLFNPNHPMNQPTLSSVVSLLSADYYYFFLSFLHFVPHPLPSHKSNPSPPFSLLFLVRMEGGDHRSGSDSKASTRLRSRHCFLWAGQSLCWHWEPQ